MSVLLGLLLATAGGLAAGTTQDFLYTVQPGDSAWSVSARYLADQRHWNDLRKTNQLRGNRLRPGQVLRIALPWLRLTTPRARLVALTGEVRRNDGTGWQPAVADSPLPAGTWLRTPQDGTATLLLEDGTRVLVRPSSELRLVPLDAGQVEAWMQLQASSAPPARRASGEAGRDAPVCIELLHGGLENAVQPRSGQSLFEVRTPAAVTTVRGTEFRISSEGDISRAEVVRGAITFGNPQGAVELGLASGSRSERGVRPLAAVPLLPAPEIGPLGDQHSPEALQGMVLPPLDGAAAYRVQWLEDGPPGQPMRLLHEHVDTSPRPGWPALADGRYRLRLRGIDALGLEGLATEHRLTVTTPPPPPVPAPALPTPVLSVRPADGRVLVQWSPMTQAYCAQVQIALDAGFTDVVFDEPTPLASLTLPVPPRTGTHHVRVRLLQSGGGSGPWSEPRQMDPSHLQGTPP